jgi:ATP-dependent Clp protease ATP-binding subunit ClpC
LFERFSKRTRQVLVIAGDEARALRHDHIGTEHLLLGLLREEGGGAPAILRSLDLTAQGARAEAIELVGYGDADAASQMRLTPRLVRAPALAAGEADRLGRADADTEHVPLALIVDAPPPDRRSRRRDARGNGPHRGVAAPDRVSVRRLATGGPGRR